MIPPDVMAHYCATYGIDPDTMPQLMEAQAQRAAANDDARRSVPPDPTKGRVTAWGNAYPCLRYTATGQSGQQCSGMMQPGRRCRRFEGRLWRHFKCDRCGREAEDWKVNKDGSVSQEAR